MIDLVMLKRRVLSLKLHYSYSDDLTKKCELLKKKIDRERRLKVLNKEENQETKDE